MDLKASWAVAWLRHCESGGNSTTRRMVPFFGGSRCTGRSAASASPTLFAGADFVSHKSVRARPGIDAISFTLRASASEMKIDLPSASWPVTTRRTFWIMSRSCDRVARGDLFARFLGPLVGREAKVELELEALLRHTELLRLGGVELPVLDDERVLHREHRIGVEVGIALHEDVRDHLLVAGRGDDRVHVRRAHVVVAGRAHQIADRAVHGNAVELRLVALEGVFALCVCLDAASQLEFAAGLQIVDAVGLRLPDVERRARDGLALDRQHPAADPDVLPLHGRPFAQVAAVSVLLPAVRKAGPEHGG